MHIILGVSEEQQESHPSAFVMRLWMLKVCDLSHTYTYIKVYLDIHKKSMYVYSCTYQ